MVSIPVEIGALRFPTKDAAKEYFRDVLYRHVVGSNGGADGSTPVAPAERNETAPASGACR
jgi:hypothetical protein